jgi:hypothetical protein
MSIYFYSEEPQEAPSEVRGKDNDPERDTRRTLSG